MQTVIAILSDIHGNWEALKAVWADMQKRRIDLVYCLGDMVGYGPESKKCLNFMREKADLILKGNHEMAVNNLLYLVQFNIFASEAIRYCRTQLNEEEKKYIDKLPHRALIKEYDICLGHGAYIEPCLTYYVFNEKRARKDMRRNPARLCFVGHLHVAQVYCDQESVIVKAGKTYELKKDYKYLINVGSVGQPRDDNPQACYGLLTLGETTTFRHIRVDYDIDKTAQAMRLTGLRSYLWERLYLGD